MRDQTITAVEKRIHNLFSDGSEYSRSMISETAMPAGIKHFLLCALKRRAGLEASRLLDVRSEWFDADDPRYQETLQMVVLSLGETARFPPKEWSQAVHVAVKKVTDYLIAPVSTLVSFIFPIGTDSISVTDLQRKTGYFSDYGYISHAANAFVERKGHQRVVKSEFEGALNHVDQQITRNYDTAAWIQSLKPLIEVVGISGLPNTGLPVVFAVQYFSVKAQNEIAEAINEAASTRKAELITVSSLEKIIASVLESQSAGQPQISNTSPPDQTEKKDLPLWKRFQAEDTDRQVHEAGQPLWKKFAGSATSRTHVTSGTDSSDVVLGSAIAQKDRYLRDLFEGNSESFIAVMNALCDSPDWSSASKIIADQVFRPYRVDIYSDVAVEFTNAVESRYSELKN